MSLRSERANSRPFAAQSSSAFVFFVCFVVQQNALGCGAPDGVVLVVEEVLPLNGLNFLDQLRFPYGG
jgi:hypothetical protein